MRAIGKFHGYIDKRTPAVADRGRARGEVSEKLPQLGTRLAGMLGKTGVEISPKRAVSPSQVMSQQILFGLELPVQAHLVDASALYNRVDADIARALEIKEILGGFTDFRVRDRPSDGPASPRLLLEAHGLLLVTK